VNGTAYFDNAATTYPKPEEVYSFMDSFYRECGVNVGRGQYKMAARATALVEETRKLLLDLNHCPNRKVVFTPSATEALNIVIRGSVLHDNANIYLSPFEHNAVTRVIEYLSGLLKLNIITLAFDKERFKYDLSGIENQFKTDKPAMVIMSHASNVCGVIAPITEICALSKPYGATNVIDMAQTMGLIDTNLNNDNIDYAVFAAHKTLYGALGLGGFICKANAKPTPLIYGGTGVDSANPSMPDNLPERYEAGSPNIAAIAALNASLKWIGKTGIRTIADTERNNHLRLLSILEKYGNIRLASPSDTDNSIGVVSCVFDGYSSDNIGQILSDHDIAVRTGLHCAPTAHRFLATFPAGTVRFSVSYFNGDEDFSRLDDALAYISENS
jgi:cysteine desulfurase family protein